MSLSKILFPGIAKHASDYASGPRSIFVDGKDIVCRLPDGREKKIYEDELKQLYEEEDWQGIKELAKGLGIFN